MKNGTLLRRFFLRGLWYAFKQNDTQMVRKKKRENSFFSTKASNFPPNFDLSIEIACREKAKNVEKMAGKQAEISPGMEEAFATRPSNRHLTVVEKT